MEGGKAGKVGNMTDPGSNRRALDHHPAGIIRIVGDHAFLENLSR